MCSCRLTTEMPQQGKIQPSNLSISRSELPTLVLP